MSLVPKSGRWDGNRIAFHRDRALDHEIYVVNADGTNEQQLTDNRWHDLWASWSANSALIAFSSERDGDHEIFVMNADGRVQKKLTHNEAYDADPSYSPDGSEIAFVRNRDGDYEIFVTECSTSPTQSTNRNLSVQVSILGPGALN